MEPDVFQLHFISSFIYIYIYVRPSINPSIHLYQINYLHFYSITVSLIKWKKIKMVLEYRKKSEIYIKYWWGGGYERDFSKDRK